MLRPKSAIVQLFLCDLFVFHLGVKNSRPEKVKTFLTLLLTHIRFCTGSVPFTAIKTFSAGCADKTFHTGNQFHDSISMNLLYIFRTTSWTRDHIVLFSCYIPLWSQAFISPSLAYRLMKNSISGNSINVKTFPIQLPTTPIHPYFRLNSILCTPPRTRMNLEPID